jgi:hypothetical protein
MAIKGEYPKILDVLDKPKFEKNQTCIDELFACNKRIFMWLAHLTTTLINSNEVLIRGFDALQESNRFSSVKASDHKKVELLINSIEMIPSIQEELIKMITNDNNLRERVLKDIMDELGIENPNKKKKKDKKFSSMSFDDWFNDD